MMHYILKGTKIVKEPDLIKWARWFEKGNRVIKQEAIMPGKAIEASVKQEVIIPVKEAEKNTCRLSTVFLGIDHNYIRKGKPILFETMVFNGKLDGEMERYTTYNAALKGHERMKQRILGGK